MGFASSLLARLVDVLVGLLFGVVTLLASSDESPLAALRAQPIDTLVAQLRSSSATERALAACALRARRSDALPAVAPLVALLADDTPVSPDTCVSRGQGWYQRDEPTTPAEEAARALDAIGPASYEPVARTLEGQSPVARRYAAFALGMLEDARAVVPLVTRLRDSEARVREKAAWALGAIEDGRAVNGLIGTLTDADPGVRSQAAWALGSIEDATAVDALERALRDPSHEVRKQSAWALGAIEDAGAIEGLVSALADVQPDVRRQAAWALGAIEDPRAVDGLVKTLDDADARVREQAAWALGAIGDSRAATKLTGALKDVSPKVRRQAAWALGALDSIVGDVGRGRRALLFVIERSLVLTQCPAFSRTVPSAIGMQRPRSTERRRTSRAPSATA